MTRHGQEGRESWTCSSFSGPQCRALRTWDIHQVHPSGFHECQFIVETHSTCIFVPEHLRPKSDNKPAFLRYQQYVARLCSMCPTRSDTDILPLVLFNDLDYNYSQKCRAKHFIRRWRATPPGACQGSERRKCFNHHIIDLLEGGTSERTSTTRSVTWMPISRSFSSRCHGECGPLPQIPRMNTSSSRASSRPCRRRRARWSLAKGCGSIALLIIHLVKSAGKTNRFPLEPTRKTGDIIWEFWKWWFQLL